uniref:Uncharacterized protein n=1 Tax=Arundo donax TaxID=35708 RepID=A0A0A9A3E8_ARUDO
MIFIFIFLSGNLYNLKMHMPYEDLIQTV